MAQVKAHARRELAAPIERVYALLRDYRERPTLLPPEYSDYQVTGGGEGTGSEYEVTLSAGRRERRYHMRVEEPAAGLLRESDAGSSLVSEWRVRRGESENSTVVEIVTTWNGAGGIGGFFERTFAPRALQRIYDQQLANLARAAASASA